MIETKLEMSFWWNLEKEKIIGVVAIEKQHHEEQVSLKSSSRQIKASTTTNHFQLVHTAFLLLLLVYLAFEFLLFMAGI